MYHVCLLRACMYVNMCVCWQATRIQVVDALRPGPRVLTGHTSTVTCLRLFDTGLGCPVAASGSYDATVCVWDLRCGTLLQRLEGHTVPIW